MPNETELLDILLTNRFINETDRDKFLNPSYDNHLHDPFSMKDMDRVVTRIFESINKNEKIIIYSDYDSDGIPAAVIINDFFKKINYSNYYIYIPDRHDEGYGLHMDAIEKFIKEDVKLLITFDLGITACSEVLLAQNNNIDVIITDHHLPQDEIPKAYAILNPKQEGCNYKDKMLCGAGIAFKLIQGLLKKYNEYWNINIGWEKWLLDMVAIATLSDQVPLLDENRVLTYYGLKVLKKGKRPGLVEILKKSGVNILKINEEDVTFSLSPKINVASRLDDPMNAFYLLSTDDIKEAKSLSDHLFKVNDHRKVMVAQIMKEVKKSLSKREIRDIIVIGNPSWRIGVLGIVASKIMDEYKRPVFVWGSDGSGIIRGSCRSFGEIDLVLLMTSLESGILNEFGGHKNAGGFSISHTEIHFLEDRLMEVFNVKNDFENNSDELKIDKVISLDDVNIKNFNVINKLAPFGVGNRKPLFLFKNIEIYKIKEFGKDKNHLELSFLNSHNKEIKAISFFKTKDDFVDKENISIGEGSKIDLVASFEKNNFAGMEDLRLKIINII